MSAENPGGNSTPIVVATRRLGGVLSIFEKNNKPSHRNGGVASLFDGSHIVRHSPSCPPPPPPPPRLHDHTSEQTHRKPRIYLCGHWPAAKPRTVTQLIRIDPSVTSERALPAQDDCMHLCMCRSIGGERERGREKESERERERRDDVYSLVDDYLASR